MKIYNKMASHKYSLPLRLILTILVGGGIFAYLIPTLLTGPLPRLDAKLHLPSFFLGLPNLIVGWLLVGIGIFFALWSIGQQLFTAQGTPIPVMATQKLIIRGVFKYCRNPMGFGAICMYTGCAILAGSICAVLTVVLFSALFILYVKRVEEKELVARFGQEYLDYKACTPFIIPWFKTK